MKNLVKTIGITIVAVIFMLNVFIAKSGGLGEFSLSSLSKMNVANAECEPPPPGYIENPKPGRCGMSEICFYNPDYSDCVAI